MNKYYKADEVEKLLNCGCAYAIWELPTIEVSEDCIDRYSALAELDPRSYEYKAVKELSSVIPKRSCYRCGLREDCEDSTERKPKEGEWIAKNGVFYCSCCDNDSAGLSEDDVYVYERPLPNYCQDCGAKMMKGVSDD